MRMLFAGGLTLLLSGIAFLVYLGYLRANPPIAAAKDVLPNPSLIGPPLEIPTFSLVDQENRPRDRSLLEGKVSIVWFMFTNCPLACPAMSMQMADMQKGLRNSGVQFVAFSLDAEHDTTAALKAYGDKFDVDWSNWVFLTDPTGQAAKNTGRTIYSRDLKQFVEDTPGNTITLVDGSGTMPNIEHAVNFFLVGPDGNVLDRGWFSSKRPEELEQLRERALAAIKYFGDKGQLKN
jgi:protein SCO1/2